MAAPIRTSALPAATPMARIQPLTAFLRTGEGAGTLIPQAEKLLTLGAAVRELLPGNLAAATQVANLKADTLVLHAANNAVAAKLKHHAPALIAGLVALRHPIGRIKIEVRPDTMPASATGCTQRLVPETGVQALTRLADELPEGPLRESVLALARKTTPGGSGR
jgi:hypothetical protein